MAAKDNLQQAAQAWQGYLTKLTPHLDDKQRTSLHAAAKQDLQRVSQGHAPLSKEEMAPVIAAALGTQVIKPQPRPSGLGAVIGNIGSDLTGIVRNLNPPTLVRNLYREGEAAKNFDMKAFTSAAGDPSKGYKDVTGAGLGAQLAESLRRDASLPFIRMLPGLQTGAGLTTAKGRESLTQHPVGALLDVLPLAGAVSKAAGLVAPEGSVAESLQAGKPLQAFDRGVGAAAAKIAPETAGKIAESTASVLRALRLDPMSRGLQRSYMEAKSSAQRDIITVIEKDITPFLEHEMTDQEKTLLHHELTNPRDYPNPSPEHQALITHARQLMADQARDEVAHDELHPVTIGNRTEYYSLDGPEGKVVEAMKSLDTHQTRLNSAIRKFKQREQFVAQRVQRNEAIVRAAEERVKKYATAGAGVGGRHRQALRALDKAQARLQQYKNDPFLARYKTEMEGKYAIVQAANDDLIKKFISTAPARYHEMLRGELLARTEARATTMYGKGSPALEEALKKVKRGDVSDVWSDEEWKNLTADVQSGWLGLVGAGYDPVHIHTVTEAASSGILYGKPMASRFITPGVVKAKVFDLRPRLTDAAMGITAGAVQLIQARGTEQFILDHVLPLAKDEAGVQKDLEPFIRAAEAKGTRGISDIANKVDQLRQQRWVEFKPSELWNFSTPRLEAIASKTKVFLPKHIADQVAELSKPMSQSELRPMFNRATALFKVSVLTGPRHLAHVTLGGAMFMLGRGHVDDFVHVREALSYARDPLKFPSAVSHGLDVMSTDQIFAEAGGNRMGTMFSKVIGPAKAAVHFEEKVADFERALAYLGGKGRALRKGLSEHEAERIGIEHANKIFMDWNGMSPIERGLLKQVMPFYSFTRHILGYVLTYPIDHPLRASILSNLAEIEAKDNKSGLPETFQNLFYLGSADKNGNVKAIDLRTFNPMRDVGNYFSLRGFFSSLHPLAQAVLQAGGVNPLTGSPQLYTQMEFDPVTGSMIGKRPPDLALRTAEAIIPPISALDHFLGLSSQMRALKASSPTGYRKALFSALNTPFVPQNYNLAQTRAKIEERLYSDASSKMTAATTSGDFGPVRGYNLAPTPAKFGGGLQSPADVEKVYQQVAAALKKKGIKAAPKAVLPTPKKKKKAALPKAQSK